MSCRIPQNAFSGGIISNLVSDNASRVVLVAGNTRMFCYVVRSYIITQSKGRFSKYSQKLLNNAMTTLYFVVRADRKLERNYTNLVN